MIASLQLILHSAQSSHVLITRPIHTANCTRMFHGTDPNEGTLYENSELCVRTIINARTKNLVLFFYLVIPAQLGAVFDLCILLLKELFFCVDTTSFPNHTSRVQKVIRHGKYLSIRPRSCFRPDAG
jgi:hypothetical protein